VPMGSAWRIVLKRGAADWLILTAVAVTVVLATTLLAAGPIYSDSVTLGALRRTLESAPADEANIEISVRVRPDAVSVANDVVGPQIARAFAAVEHDVHESASAEAYTLPDQVDDGVADIAVFQYFEGVEDHASLISGAWPKRSEGPHEAVISDLLASNLQLTVGDVVPVTNRRDQTVRVVLIVSIYGTPNAADPFWYNDQLALETVTHSPSFNTHGPFIVDRETLLQDLTAVNNQVRWRVITNIDSIMIEDRPSLIGNLGLLKDRLNDAGGPQLAPTSTNYDDFAVDGSLRSILLEADRSLTVTRSGVLMLSVQLSILAGLALVLTAGLLVDSRRIETDLLRSRGATSDQILRMSLAEGAMLTLPAAAVAPWLAVGVLALLDRFGPLASIGLELDPSPTVSAFILSFLAALGCMAALAAPAYRSSRSFSESYVKRGRQESRSELQRAGVDLALLAAAAIGFWQLSVHSETITTSVRGRLGIDPLLVAGPAVGLVAGAVLALRLIPLLARLSDRMAGATKSTVPALSAWQISRRPARYARSALLLIMAVAIGVFAATYSVTWIQSQEDQAAFDVGADVRVLPNRRLHQSIEDIHLRSALRGIETVAVVMPLVRVSGAGSDSEATRRFVMLDAAQAADVVRIREDIGPDFVEAMESLVARRPSLASVSMPGEPMRVSVLFDVEVDPIPENIVLHEDPIVCFCPSVRVIVQDGDGLLHRIDLGDLAVDSGPQRLEADLLRRLDDGQEVEPTYPLALIDVEVRSPTPLDVSRKAVLTFGGVFTSPQPDGESWALVTNLDESSWESAATSVADAFVQPAISSMTSIRRWMRRQFTHGRATVDGLVFEIVTGRVFSRFPLPGYFSIRPSGTTITEPFPVVTTTRLMEALELEIGTELRLRELRIRHDAAVIVSSVEDFPTVDPTGGEAIIIDLPTFQMAGYESGKPIPVADEYWISAGGGETGDLSTLLRGSPYDSLRVIDENQAAELRKTDPIALGAMGSLSMGFVAAAVFASVGFAVSATVSARERLTEFALLRALGLSNPQLGAWLAIEQAALVALSLGLGTAIGLLLSWLALPLISVTQVGTVPIPSLTVQYPWSTILLLELAVVGSLAVIVTVLITLLRRLGLGSLLRLGVD